MDAKYEQGDDLENQNVDLEAYIDNRVFTGPELLPNKYLTSHFDDYATTPTNSAGFAHEKGVNDKTAGVIAVDGDLTYKNHKIHTSTALNLESDAEYYYAFKVSNWTGTGVLHGPALMSGDEITGKYGDFHKEITGDGYYYGTMTINLNRNTAPNTFNQSNVRDFMFNIKTEGFECDISHFSLKKVITNNKESVKSIRNYKLGVVYADEYGRETPVLTGKTASLSVPKANAKSINCIKSTIKSDPPTWATPFKYFVKETSSDYTNIALDRIYKSGDQSGGYWLSFPSSERNKVDEDDFLILKKSHNETVAVDSAEAIYKVLDISNNAPDFIKTNRNSIGEGGDVADINNDLFENVSTRPLTGSNTISFNKDSWISTEGNNNLSELIKTKDLVFKFKNNVNQVSRIDDVDAIEIIDFSGSDNYQIKMKNPCGYEDNDFIIDAHDDDMEKNEKIE